MASFSSQGYVALLGMLTLPALLLLMGPEHFGVVAFYGLVQTIYSLLDFGLSGMLARDVAKYRAGQIDDHSIKHLTRVTEVCFLSLTSIGFLALALNTDTVSSRWITAKSISIEEMNISLQLIGGIASVRLLSALYRSIIGGFERQLWLASVNSTIATFRFVLVLPALSYLGATLTAFFGYQLIIALAELALLRKKANHLLPNNNVAFRLLFDFRPIKKSLQFTASLSFLSIVWILFTQIDKLLVSRIVPIDKYGYYSIAVTLASGLLVISSPLTSVITPRLTVLASQGKTNETIHLYRKITRTLVCIIFPIACTLAIHPELILRIWTGNAAVVNDASATLALYAIGNAFLVISGMPFCLQYANGNFRLNVIGNIFFLLLMVPTMIFLINRFGLTGAGIGWLTLNTIYLFGWTTIVHSKLIPSIKFTWLTNDVLMPAVICGIISLLIFKESSRDHSTITAYLLIFATLVILLIFMLLYFNHKEIITYSHYYYAKKIKRKSANSSDIN